MVRIDITLPMSQQLQCHILGKCLFLILCRNNYFFHLKAVITYFWY